MITSIRNINKCTSEEVLGDMNFDEEESSSEDFQAKILVLKDKSSMTID